MNNLFEEEKPKFLSVNKNGFMLDGKQYQTINVLMENIIPVRKLFEGKTIKCYSNNAKIGKDGQRCILCSKKTKCSRRLRLMMLVLTDDEEVPSILEINKNSFENLKKEIENIEENNLRKTLIEMQIKQDNKYLQVFFKVIF